MLHFLALLTEVGTDFSRFPTVGAFCSWLRFCANPKISGGHVLSVRVLAVDDSPSSSKTRPTKNRTALALRLAAQALHRSQTFLGEYFRRMKARLGAPKAITAVAHKLARIIYHMIIMQHEFDATIFHHQERQSQDRKRNRLLVQAKELGLQLVPVIEAVP